MNSEGCVVCEQSHSLIKPWSAHFLTLSSSAWQRVFHQRLGLKATMTGLQSVQVFLSQTTPDDFLAHSKWNTKGMIRREFINPFFADLLDSSFPGIVMLGYPF
jgi:hypothetical protein